MIILFQYVKLYSGLITGNKMKKIIETSEFLKRVKKLNSKDRKKFIFKYLLQYLECNKCKIQNGNVSMGEALKKKELDMINAFLGNKDVNLADYNKLAVKISKKWENKFYKEPENIKTIAKYIIKNHEDCIFYEKLKQFLLDFYPTVTMTAFIGIIEFNIDKNHPKYNKKINEKISNVEKNNIPLKSFFIYLITRYSYNEDKLLQGKYDRFGYSRAKSEDYLYILKKYVNDYYFEIFGEIMDIITVSAQIKLMTLLFNSSEEKSVNYIFSQLINKKLNEKVITTILESIESVSIRDKYNLNNKMIELLKSKKITAREIALKSLIKWNDDKTKEILKNTINKEKNEKLRELMVNYIA